jgi:hypothetical protein
MKSGKDGWRRSLRVGGSSNGGSSNFSDVVIIGLEVEYRE